MQERLLHLFVSFHHVFWFTDWGVFLFVILFHIWLLYRHGKQAHSVGFDLLWLPFRIRKPDPILEQVIHSLLKAQRSRKPLSLCATKGMDQVGLGEVDCRKAAR